MDDINYTSTQSNDGGERQKISPDALSDMVGRLMSNPEIMSMIGSMMGKAPKPTVEENSVEDSPSSDEAAEPVSTQASDSPAADVSAKLPEVISALSPMLSGLGNIKSDKPTKLSPKDERRVCLLRAIKPYVSRGRGEAIDYMIQLSRISELMKHLN